MENKPLSLWALVPVKPLVESKSCLAGVLTADQRIALVCALLENTLGVLAVSPAVDRVLVVSRDPAVLELARSLGAEALLEDGLPELNASLEYAGRFAAQHGAGLTLALPADLPLVSAEDIATLVALAAASGDCAVIAPDRRGEGTNALLTRPPGAIPYRFGVGSFDRHCLEAAQAGLRVEIVRRPGFALDLDLPEDLVYWRG